MAQGSLDTTWGLLQTAVYNNGGDTSKNPLVGFAWPKILQLQNESREIRNSVENEDKCDIFQMMLCPFCKKYLDEPISLQCGCTCCKDCGSTKPSSLNKICTVCSKTSHLGNNDPRRTNVILNSLFEKWFLQESESLKSRIQGDEAFAKKDFENALKIYDAAVQKCPANHVAWNNRSKVLHVMHRNIEALECSEKACEQSPFWDQAYLQKARVLLEFERKGDAAVALMVCLAIDNGNSDALSLLDKVMFTIVRESPSVAFAVSSDSGNSHDETSHQHTIEHAKHMDTDDHSASAIPNLTFRSTRHNPIEGLLLKFREELKAKNNNSPRKILTEEEKERLASDLECNLCGRLFYEPVTTVCGHVFCKDCLRRLLDHNYKCPLCRYSLFEYISLWKLEVTQLIDEITKMYFLNERNERAIARTLETEALARVSTETDEDIPIFVCCISLPTRPLQLQIFEPRYRLMLRQCLDSGSRQFGMCVYDPDNGFAEYGTMVEVKDAFIVPDGRAFVESAGGRRFKVLSRGIKDGYNTAKVQWIKDSPIPEGKIDDLIRLNTEVHAQMKAFVMKFIDNQNALQQFLADELQLPDMENEKIGTRDGPSWLWWLVDCFIQPTEVKVLFISTESLEQRLLMIKGQLQLNS